MLYDPKWKKPQADIFKLAGLIAWLETQDPAETYEYKKADGTCLISRYLAAMGYNSIYDYGKFESLGTRQIVAQRSPQTYGAALQRARTALCF